MRFVSRQWTAQGWCWGHTLPSARVAGGRMWGFEIAHLESGLGHPSPTER